MLINRPPQKNHLIPIIAHLHPVKITTLHKILIRAAQPATDETGPRPGPHQQPHPQALIPNLTEDRIDLGEEWLGAEVSRAITIYAYLYKRDCVDAGGVQGAVCAAYRAVAGSEGAGEGGGFEQGECGELVS
jgi:hypothetical protein